VSKNRQSNNRRTQEAVAIVVSRLCWGVVRWRIAIGEIARIAISDMVGPRRGIV
jgi:hypothetical protein